MRLALCTLSAVLLSGCSWLGIGGNGSSSYNQYGANAGCATGSYGGGQYGASQYGYGGGAGCYGVGGSGYGAGAGAYGMNGYGAGAGGYGAGAGYGAGMGGYGAGAGGAGAGYGAGGYGAGAGAYGAGLGPNGLRGAQGATSYAMNGYGAGGGAAYGAGAGTVLGAGAGTQFGSAVSGGQFVNGQWVANGVTGGANSTYQTVQGAPIYVPQPYPAYYGVASGGGYAYGGGLRGGGAALPFGIEGGIGTSFAIDGDIFPGEAAKPAIPGPGTVSALVPVSYKDAYGEAVNYDLAATYDIDPSTTILGRIGYSNAEGNVLSVGSVDNGAGLTEELFAQFGDLEQVTLEGGVRKYMGGWNNRFAGVRPYVGATAGFTHNNSVDVVQSSATLVDPAAFTQEYIDAGWTPTASGVVGAEMQVGPRTAIGVETGIRWNDDLDTNFDTGDRWSVPLKLRGRVSF